MLIHILSVGIGPLPALGALMSFSQGIFANAREKTFDVDQVQLPDLKSSVEIIFDKNKVPHIIAQNKWDLYLAQGFLMAKYRLWQMDMTTRAGGAELSEVLGTRTEKIDQFFFQVGLRQASKESFELMKADEGSYQAIKAYTLGVNSFIEKLTYKEWPVEYKVVRFKPRPFSEDRVAQLLKIMAFNLAARSYDLPLSLVSQKLGWKASLDLFPDHYGPGLPFPGFDDFIHQSEGSISNTKTESYKGFSTSFKSFPDFLLPFQTDGSNSWMISKEKSKDGHNIMSNDTHLGLRSPSVWFESRLYVPGVLDVYGASFPGAPGVILGMSQNLSWGSTNGTLDVVDWFEIEFKSEDSFDYLLDGNFVSARELKGSLLVNKSPEQKVSVLQTVFGPVVHREGLKGLAVKWTGNEPSNELQVFLGLDEARSVAEAKDILKNYTSPIQNFSLADKNEIAIVTAGLFPLKEYGFGRVVEDGRKTHPSWSKMVSLNESLTTSHPLSGFLHSANQRQVGSDFFTYIGWDFEQPFRGLRIRETLKSKDLVSIEDVFSMQNEGFNELAHYFFKIVDRNQVYHSLNPQMQKEFAPLLEWDLIDSPTSSSTTLFYAWIKEIEESFWAKPFSFQKKKFYPKKSRTLEELQNRKESQPEKFFQALGEDFHSAIKNLRSSRPDPKSWVWGQVQPTVFKHVTSFPGFESATVSPQGSKYSLNSNKGSHGGAWRFVAQMSEPPKAWSQIPGGMNGNPVLKDYSENVEEWAKGQFKEVQFLPPDKVRQSALFILKLAPQ